MSFSKEIIAIIDNLCQKFGIAIDWTAENVMPYLTDLAERFIRFEIQTSIFWMALMVGVCIILWVATLVLYHKANTHGWDFEIFIIACVISAFWSVATIVVIGVQVYDILTAINIPEKLIYDYITNAINNKLQ